MSFPGPFPVSSNQTSSVQDVSFHLYQRVTAHVVQVGATQAVLEVNGYPVVARLTSKDQAAELLSRRSADFVITQLSSDQITLKFAGKEEKGEGKTVLVDLKDPALELSKAFGLKGTDSEVQLIRSAILQNISVSGKWVEQTLDAVARSGLDESTAIALAVKLKAAGLPVTPSSIQWASQFQEPQMGEALAGMLSELSKTLSQMDPGTPLAAQARMVLNQLHSLIPDLSMGEEKIAENLKQLFQFIGKSFEKWINETSSGESEKDSFNLLTLVNLGKDLRQIGQGKAADGIDHFLDQARQMQFNNIRPDEIPGKGQWAELNFLVKWPGKEEDQNSRAQIRISYRQEESRAKIDPEYTNLMLKVELEPEKQVTADISLYHKKVNANLLVSDPALENLFHHSLPDLEDLLGRLGYTVIQADTKLRLTGEEKNGQVAPSGLSPENRLDVEA